MDRVGQQRMETQWSTLAGCWTASWQSLTGGEAGISRLNLTLDIQILSPQRWPDFHLSFILSPLGNQRLPLESVFHPPKDLL